MVAQQDRCFLGFDGLVVSLPVWFWYEMSCFFESYSEFRRESESM